METKHTKGNWGIKQTTVSGYLIQTAIVTDLKFDDPLRSPVICDMFGMATENGAANAKLIAAAPEMLEALLSFTDNIDNWLKTGIAADPKSSKAIYDAAKAAIKKATL